MGMFDKVETVARQFDKNFLRDGRYILRIEEVRSGTSRKGEHWRFTATVLNVIDEGKDPGKGHKVGETVKRLRPDKQDGSIPEFKAFVCCMYECEDSEVKKENCDTILGDTQPLAGAVVEVFAQTVETGKSTPVKPAYFTRVDYIRRIPDADVAELIGAEAFAKFFPDGIKPRAT